MPRKIPRHWSAINYAVSMIHSIIFGHGQLSLSQLMAEHSSGTTTVQRPAHKAVHVRHRHRQSPAKSGEFSKNRLFQASGSQSRRGLSTFSLQALLQPLRTDVVSKTLHFNVNIRFETCLKESRPSSQKIKWHLVYYLEFGKKKPKFPIWGFN